MKVSITQKVYIEVYYTIHDVTRMKHVTLHTESDSFKIDSVEELKLKEKDFNRFRGDFLRANRMDECDNSLFLFSSEIKISEK